MKKDTEIRYGVHPSPFGNVFIATFHGEVCALAWVGKGGVSQVLRDVKSDIPGAVLMRDQKSTETFAKTIFSPSKKNTRIPFVLHGTDFQIKVWDALSRIPFGSTTTYADIAQKIGSPKAVRAVGTACGKNTLAYLIPCHRVMTSSGDIGGYRWGVRRKKELLVWESSQA